MPRWRLSIAALACAACGRVAFDPLSDAGSTSARHYRRHFIVQNTSASQLDAGYSIRVQLAIDPGKARADRADVRVVLPARATPTSTDAGVTRLVELGSETLWFPLGQIVQPGGQADFYLYYGDDSVLGTTQGDVFHIFDDFTANTRGPMWQVTGTPTGSSDGTAMVLGPGDTGVTTNAATAGIPATSVIELRCAITNPGGPGNYYWFGYQHTGDFGTGAPFINWVGGSSGPGVDAIIHPWVNTTSSSTGMDVTQDTAFHVYRIERRATSTQFFRDDVLVSDLTLTDASIYSVQLRNNSTANDLVIDWVRARPLVTPEPTVTFDAEQAL